MQDFTSFTSKSASLSFADFSGEEKHVLTICKSSGFINQIQFSSFNSHNTVDITE